MLFIQLIFIVRDNLASRLDTGSVSALTYGWMFFQMPETLIGTAIGTAMLPGLSELAAKNDWKGFARTIENAIQTLIAITLPIAAVMGSGLGGVILEAFHFTPAQTDLVLWVTRGYLLGLAGQCIVEVMGRSFYSKKDSLTPLYTAGFKLVVFIGLGILFIQFLGVPGLALADCVAFSGEAILLLWVFSKRTNQPANFVKTLPRGIIGALVGGGITLGLTMLLGDRVRPILVSILAMAIGGIAVLPIMWKELKQLTRL
jgi:putative peptidoglycan lipid II flippase